MFRGIIGMVEGSPDGEISRNRGAVNIEGERLTNFSDDGLVSGAASSTVEKEQQVPLVSDQKITTTREEAEVEVFTEFLANLHDGWVSVDRSDGEFLWEFLGFKHHCQIERAAIDLDKLTHEIRDWESVDVWQSQASRNVPGEDDTPVTISYHDDAEWPDSGVGQLGFGGLWDGVPLRGIIARSGYVALFNATEEQAARFLSDVVLKHCFVPDDGQETLGGSR